MAQNNWHLCLQHLERELPSEDMNTFIRPLEVVNNKNRIRLVAPNSYVNDHVATNYLERIRDIFEHLGASRDSVSIEEGLPAIAAVGNNNSEPRGRDKTSSGLDSRYRFDNFVLGKSNELGYAAASQIAQKPGDATPCCYMAAPAWARPTYCMPLETPSVNRIRAQKCCTWTPNVL